MKTQTRMFLPSHSQALRKLREEASLERASADTLERLREGLKSAKAEVDAAEAELIQSERNLMDAPEESSEATAADLTQAKAWGRLRRGEQGVENLQATVKAAAAEHGEAARRLRAAREDLESVRQGRRKT